MTKWQNKLSFSEWCILTTNGFGVDVKDGREPNDAGFCTSIGFLEQMRTDITGTTCTSFHLWCALSSFRSSLPHKLIIKQRKQSLNTVYTHTQKTQSNLFTLLLSFFSFGVTVNAEAGMTVHSQRWGLIQAWPSARIPIMYANLAYSPYNGKN